jgi:alkylation response protein AidB-like acyl-CoA dehydrogenase
LVATEQSGGIEDVADAIAALSLAWADERPERQTRRSLDGDDFDRLADTGFLRTVVPAEHGGLWRGITTSARPVIGMLRTLAQGDPSVALVAAMHPAVVSFWLMSDTPGSGPSAAWTEQRVAVFDTALDGHQWGTITSEPGSGGDIARTRSKAVADPGAPTEPVGDPFRISGDKHFGSGSGITSFMITTALAEGDDEPAIFVLDTRERPWETDGPMTLIAEWDGMGMAATQSHAMRLEAMPAVRCAWPDPFPDLAVAAGPFNAGLFTGVVLGVLDSAIEAARHRLAQRLDGGAGALRPFEQTEWVRAEMDHWLAVQAYEGALRALESGSATRSQHGCLRAKQSVARLAESTMTRLTRVLGGGTFSQRSPFAHWYEDVRALGFLRPPWALADDNLFATSFQPE